MKTLINKLIRKDLQNFSGYKPEVWSDPLKSRIIKLNSGENPYINPRYAYYPDPQCSDLRAKISAYTGVNPNQIVCGNGSDELIDLVTRIFIEPGNEIIVNPPTFSMYQFYGQLNRANIISVPRLPNLEVNIPDILSRINPNTKLIFIDSPGNPSGTVINNDQLIPLLETGVIVCVDEAYFEYCNQTCVPLLNIYSNLIILRTFSKWAGLASLRLGYALADEQIVSVINSIKSPYNVNSVAQREGLKVLSNISKVQNRLSKLVTVRQQVIQRLSKLPGFTVLPSQSAYIVFRPAQNVDYLLQKLEVKNIFIKKLNQPPLENFLRLNLGRPKDIKFALTQIAKLCKPDYLIFDIDGTLVDVSQSYRETIRLTAQGLLKRPVSKSEVNSIKSKPCMNNDWDATFALISSTQNLELYEKVKSRFQKYYLGTKNSPGLIDKEKLLINKSFLDSLSQIYKLAIVTGRPRREALYTLKRLEILKYFRENSIICMEDTTLGKPNPEPILKCLNRLKSTSAIYIGDSINDTLAASKAGIPSIYIGKEKQGDMQISNINQLPKLLKSLY